MRYCIHIVLVILSFTIGSQGIAQSSVETRLYSNEIKIGEQVQLEIKVVAPSGTAFNWPTLLDTLNSKVEILEQSEIDTTVLQGADSYTTSLTLTCFDTGVFEIPPYQTSIEGTRYQSQGHLLSVVGLEVDTSAAVKGIKDPYDLPYTWKEIAYLVAKYGGIAWLSIAVLALIAYLLGKNAKPKSEKVEVPSVPIDQWINEEIEKLEEQKLWQTGEYKKYHILLSDLSRTYLERKHGIHAMELTTFDLEKQIVNVVLPDDIKQNLLQGLRISDLVKFAKAEPLASENEQALSALKELVKHDEKQAELLKNKEVIDDE